MIDRMEVDDTNKLTRFLKDKTISSDHNNLFLYINAKLPQNNNKRLEIFNLRDSESMEMFKRETTKVSNLTECFLKQNELEKQIAEWKNKLDNTVNKCFKKIRIGGKTKESKASKLINKRAKLKQIHCNTTGEERKSCKN